MHVTDRETRACLVSPSSSSSFARSTTLDLRVFRKAAKKIKSVSSSSQIALAGKRQPSFESQHL
jgi:hypothetical protein